MKSNRASNRAAPRRALVLAVASCFVVGSTFAQSLPANSSDSGRRAVVAIDQTSINNNIKNVQNTANHAVNLTNGASGTAAQALSVANQALSAANNNAGGRVVGQFDWNNCSIYATGCSRAKGLCITGFPIPPWPFIPTDLCPPGSGYYGNWGHTDGEAPGGPI
ncbi:hypothetical protein NU688_33020 [Variovorax sp. ZS18.2.2]|uniref:hypothetical protein n=1 Tax=Variovorax sp. ZS18.2.2 TaxID=2971255 RepID=UPI002151FD41|nr:hypothetical protein [Variovorax sp. ZS18.2.2]MCR6481020.1 hypothetical protein [Variovorax sp. ZS18.2.2]